MQRQDNGKVTTEPRQRTQIEILAMEIMTMKNGGRLGRELQDFPCSWMLEIFMASHEFGQPAPVAEPVHDLSGEGPCPATVARRQACCHLDPPPSERRAAVVVGNPNDARMLGAFVPHG